MIFSSPIFLFVFLPAVLSLYYIAGRISGNIFWRNLVLLLFSCLFYVWGGVNFIALLMLSTLTDYGLALLIDRFRDRRRWFAVLSVGGDGLAESFDEPGLVFIWVDGGGSKNS